MTVGFRPFDDAREEAEAAQLIGSIDRGERQIFEGRVGSCEFSKRLFHRSRHAFGVFAACVRSGRLRIQVAFDTDMPGEVEPRVLALLEEEVRKADTDVDIWYRPENPRLEALLTAGLPWQVTGHKTHELALAPGCSYAEPELGPNTQIVPFETVHLYDTLIVLDEALAHTYDDPKAKVFAGDPEMYLRQWTSQPRTHDCHVMLEGGSVIGAYVLKGAEIDLMAIAPKRQRRGLGKRPLRHAIHQALTTSEDTPHLYCIDKNSEALAFYLSQGLKVTAHSGYLLIRANDPYRHVGGQ